MAEALVVVVLVVIFGIVDEGGLVDDDADAEAEEVVNWTVPTRIALGEVVVDGDNVDTFAGESVEIGWEQGDQGLAFAGFHLGDVAFVKHHTADQLHVKGAHSELALGGFTNDGESVGENGVQGFLVVGLREFFL